MDWASLDAAADAAMLSVFGVPASFIPQDESGPQTITGIVMRPRLLEDLPPGYGAGTSNLRFWVSLETITPTPQHGDQLSFGGNTYVVQEIEADVGGGSVLVLRITC